MRWNCLAVAILLATLGVARAAADAGAAPVFPGASWEAGDAARQGLSTTALAGIEALMREAEANGVLIHNGYLMAEWNFGGPADRHFETQSIAKSIMGMLLGLALKDGRAPSLDAKVKDCFPAFEVGPYTMDITFRHLINASSGIKSTITAGRYVDPGNAEPGQACQYHNDHCHHLARALTYMYASDLEEVLRERVLKPIGAQDDVAWGAHGTVALADGREARVVAGYAFSSWTARDLARVGYLYLHDGSWDGEQLLPRGYAAACRKPVSLPVLEWSADPPPERDMTLQTYGLGWRGRRSGDGRILWHMSGNGGQFCVVMPERGLVMTKVNRYDKTPHIGLEHFEPFLLELAP